MMPKQPNSANLKTWGQGTNWCQQADCYTCCYNASRFIWPVCLPPIYSFIIHIYGPRKALFLFENVVLPFQQLSNESPSIVSREILIHKSYLIRWKLNDLKTLTLRGLLEVATTYNKLIKRIARTWSINGYDMTKRNYSKD